MSIFDKLDQFAKENHLLGKGPLSVMLVVTGHAIKNGLPLAPESLLTNGGGQVVGLGKAAVQNILNKYGIERVLAEEGGRTSRGSVGNMRKYIAFLNTNNTLEKIDLATVENWWIDRVKEFFAGKPMVLRFDAAKSMRTAIRDLINQAEKRQSSVPGSTLVGTVLQHLVGAKLNLLLDNPPDHYGVSVADEVSGREGDFIIADVAVHVTTAPTEALVRKCKRNLDHGIKPIIITTYRGTTVAEELARQVEIADRLDVFEAEQFLAGNLYELGKFGFEGRKATAANLILAYNEIINACETDPALRIELAK